MVENDFNQAPLQRTEERGNEETHKTDRYLRIYEILDRRHVHDEDMLVNRTNNFMLVNSFLIVAYATLATNEVSLSYVLPIIGIVICIVFYPLLYMQLETARLWLRIEAQMEKEMPSIWVFPVVEIEGDGLRREVTTAPNQRHKQMTAGRPWWRLIWMAAPIVLVTLTLGLWAALLILPWIIAVTAQ